mmetsp:Transcript_12835/g.19281  ORF Transcript_12835/g.19281 Transcript_12835/m.19281 type:complete len:385 (+) Transcript_12835:1-1155(+)
MNFKLYFSISVILQFCCDAFGWSFHTQGRNINGRRLKSILYCESVSKVADSNCFSRKNIGKKIAVLASLSLFNTLQYPQITHAIGSLFEFRSQNLVLQDVSFNVPTPTIDAEVLNALFVNKCNTLRSSAGKEEIVIGFGPDAFAQPNGFMPGVSSFSMYGGHATLTLKSNALSDGTVEIYEKGNGLQYIKIGAEDIRLSKGIEKGANIKYAYGWVDLDTPGNIPVEVVVGITRDPIMIACIRVSNLQQSIQFFTETMGMSQLPFPLSRAPGSAFEPAMPKDAVYMGYSESSMGVLLKPTIKGDPPLRVGSQLNGFTVIVDDSSKSGQVKGSYSAPIASILDRLSSDAKLDEASRTILSPDGYPFIIKPFSQFSQQSTTILEPNL